jgi:hypothetical protein
MRALAVGRMSLGFAALLAPIASGELLVGEEVRRPWARLLSRMTGVREIALGAALLRSAATGSDVRTALILCAACDAVDGVAALGDPTFRRPSASCSVAIVELRWRRRISEARDQRGNRGGSGIRTRGGLHPKGFQDLRIRPLCHPSGCKPTGARFVNGSPTATSPPTATTLARPAGSRRCDPPPPDTTRGI